MPSHSLPLWRLRIAKESIILCVRAHNEHVELINCNEWATFRTCYMGLSIQSPVSYFFFLSIVKPKKNHSISILYNQQIYELVVVPPMPLTIWQLILNGKWQHNVCMCVIIHNTNTYRDCDWRRRSRAKKKNINYINGSWLNDYFHMNLTFQNRNYGNSLHPSVEWIICKIIQSRRSLTRHSAGS